MKTTRILKSALIFGGLLCVSLAARAADRFKADNADNLNLGTSWSLGTPPTSADVGVWNSTVTAPNTTLLGADTNWAGIRIADPAGLVTISAGNTLTLSGSGVDMSAAAQDLTLNNAVALGAAQTWNVGVGRMLTTGALVSGTNRLTKDGNGTLILAVSNNFSGGTVINGGTVQANNAFSFGATAGGLTNNNGATLRINTTVSIANPVNFNGTVTLDLNNVAGNEALTGSWSGNGTVNFINQDNTAARTFTMGGSSANWNNFSGTVNVGTNTGTFRFNDGGGNGNVGSSNAVLNLGTATATFLQRNVAAPSSVGAVSGGPNTKITAGSNGNGTYNYSIGGRNMLTTFEGTILDSTTARFAGITKVGTNVWILTGTNTYTGQTTINAGTLQIGNGGASGTIGVSNVVVNANLVFNTTTDALLTNNISTASAGNVIKSNLNTITYYGSNGSAGVNFLVNEGTFQAGDGAIIKGKVVVAGSAFFSVSNAPLFVFGGTLAGTGTAGTNLTAGTGANISPADTGVAGTLNCIGGLKLLGGVTLKADLSNIPSSPTANDRVVVTGDLDVSTGTNSIEINALTSLASGTYTLITYTGSLIGSTNNFTCPDGIVTNPPGAIALIVSVARAKTNLTWVGDGGANQWNTGTSTNWRSALAPSGPGFTFLLDDSVRFENVGGTNPVVNITASVSPEAILVNSATNYTFTGSGSIIGSSGLVKSNTGTLTLVGTNNYTGPNLIAGGAIALLSVADGGQPSPLGSSISASSNLVFVSSKLRFEGTSASTDRGATLNGTGVTVDVTNETETLTIGGVLTGPGGLTKIGPGTLSLTGAGGYTGGVAISNGVLALDSNAANNSGTTSGLGSTNNTVTFYGGTLRLFGYNGGTGANYNTVYNLLSVPAGQTGTLQLFPRGPVNTDTNAGLQSSLTGGGTLNLVVNYVRDDLSGNWSAFTGTVNVTGKNPSGDEMRINNNFGLANAAVILNDGVILDRSVTAGTTNDIGDLTGTSLAVVGAGNLSGANTTWRVGAKGMSSTFAGTISSDNSIIKVGGGTWTLTGANTHTGSTTISNGVLKLGDGVTDGSIGSSAQINVVSGASLNVTGRSDGTLSLNSGQTLGGNGTVVGKVDTTPGGNIAPGFSVGTLTATDAVTLGGTATMEIVGPSSSDKLVAPSIALGGTLVVTNVGAKLQAGNTFDLFDGSLSSLFTTVVLPNYYTWNTGNLGVNGTISVSAVLPPPKFATITHTATDVTLSVTNGAPNGGFVILTSTNVGLPTINWTPIETNTFDGSGNYTSPAFPIDPGTTKQFYLLQAF